METRYRVIEICEDCLTIGTKQFLDDCVSLSEEETEAVWNLLQHWKRNGAHAGREAAQASEDVGV